MLGVKLEDQEALDRAAQTLSVPGLAFAELPADSSTPPPSARARQIERGVVIGAGRRERVG